MYLETERLILREFTINDAEDIYEILGYAFEICRELICHGFESMGLHKICAEAIDSIKSVSLMKKLGMTQEGIRIKNSKSNDGEWRDVCWYAILAEDYLHSNKE